VAQLGARLDGIEEVVGSNPIGSTKTSFFSSVRSVVKSPLNHPWALTTASAPKKPAAAA
jgi:hypothetical protein